MAILNGIGLWESIFSYAKPYLALIWIASFVGFLLGGDALILRVICFIICACGILIAISLG